MINNFEKSNMYRSEIHKLIPGGAHTYSKGDDQFPLLSPAAISHGKGAYVWDLDGNKYLDCSMGLTSVSLGHAYEPVLQKVREEIEKGVNFQRPSYIEREMAKEFLSLIPCHDRIKFAKNGSSITTAATKISRAYTGRKMIAFPGDHPFYSYDDWFIGTTSCNRGVPEEVQALSVTYDGQNLNSLEDLFYKYPDKIACVISEPERFMGQSPSYLKELIALTHKHGALFIQDEMISGFKTDFPGAISKYAVTPDLATWGKGIANGFSFCALTGKAHIMDLGSILKEGEEKVFLISTTHGGETHALAAGLASIHEFKTKGVIKHNHKIGDLLISKIKKELNKHNMEKYIQLYPCNWFIVTAYKNKLEEYDAKLRTLFLQEMIKRGVLFQGAFVPCFAHSESDVDFFMQAFSQSLEIYQVALESGTEKYLVGKECKPVFRKYV
ncbi:MAG: glutamate-1-semialdehyde 2,1-aminomutase [Bacteriovoracaceae bacterium]|nr:glutamate-1-semialdehyde 2,1-aminomutase [Bacteriovoracaceae bacterium]